MEASLGWITITGYAMIQNLAFFFLFLTQRSANKSIKWILAALSLCAGLLLFQSFFQLATGYEQFANFIFVLNSLWYVIGPLLYIYLRGQIKGNGVSWLDLLHLLPAILMLINTMDFLSYSEEVKLHYFHQYNQGKFIASVHNINYILFLVQVVGYVIASLHLFRSSDSSNPNQKWHKILLIGLIVFAGLGLIMTFSANVGNHHLIQINSRLFILWLTAYVLIIFIRSVRYPEQLFFAFKRQKEVGKINDYQQTIREISAHFSLKKPFLNPDYNIHQMALELGYSKNHIQQAIRQEKNESFRNYLNQFRIAEAKEQLSKQENRQFTIQAISENAGFRSLATFYRAFKKMEGQTPSEYLKGH